MDLTTLRIVTTVLCFIMFLGIVVWAYARGNKERFDEASRLPFMPDPCPSTEEKQRHE